MGFEDFIDDELRKLYEIHDYKHAAAILVNEFPEEWEELKNALLAFRFTRSDVIALGGNESRIPKRFSKLLRAYGWHEKNLSATLNVFEKKGKKRGELKSTLDHGSHKVDYLKGRVAFDLEWNSKDQTFDRDLYAFRAFFEYDSLSVGVLVTRSNDLDSLFEELGEFVDKDGKTKKVKSKYGASTTHMGKLLPRLAAGRNGGCPVLVFGIKRDLLIDEIVEEN